jgi:hypothetical protein
MTNEKYTPSVEEIKQAEAMMDTSQLNETQLRVREQVGDALGLYFKEKIAIQDPISELVTFHEYDKPENVKKILEQKGVDTSGLEISVVNETKGYDHKDGTWGGDAYPGTTVTVKMGETKVFEHFYDSPDEKYEY